MRTEKNIVGILRFSMYFQRCSLHKNPARAVLQQTENKRNDIVIPYVASLSEKLQRIFNKRIIPVHLKPSNTRRQKLIHAKDIKHSHTIQQEMLRLETKQLLQEHMAEHGRPRSSGKESAVHLHLKEKGRFFWQYTHVGQ